MPSEVRLVVGGGGRGGADGGGCVHIQGCYLRLQLCSPLVANTCVVVCGYAFRCRWRR